MSEDENVPGGSAPLTGKAIYDCGLKPIYVRLAANLIDKGVGRHQHDKLDVFGFDYAEVSVKNKWERFETPEDEQVWRKQYCVEFFKNGKVRKWIDFSVSMSGGGGDPSFRVYDLDGTENMKMSPWEKNLEDN